MTKIYPLSFLVLVAFFFSCASETIRDKEGLDPAGDVEAVSLLGKPLRTRALSKESRKKLEQQLAAAAKAFNDDPDDEHALIWLGRRTAYLGRYREAIDIYTMGIEKHPNSARLYRHRGHRYITVRDFKQAIDDLEHAAGLIVGTADEIEPDGMPNARNIPTSTLHSNIWYHLGLARYLSGDFEKGFEAYLVCVPVSNNPDMLVATLNWLYMTLKRLGRDEEAARVLEPVHADMDIIENGSYHRLLLLYKGEHDPATLLEAGEDVIDNATLGYGIGNWHFYNGRKDQAEKVFEEIIKSDQWAAFGYIAAEAELSRF